MKKLRNLQTKKLKSGKKGRKYGFYAEDRATGPNKARKNVRT